MSPNGTFVSMQADAPSAIDWPIITIGAMTLQVKWHFSAVIEMSKRGFSMRDLDAQNPRSMFAHMELFAILVAPIFRAQQQVPPSADYWAGQLGETDAVYLSIVRGINESFVKANPPKRTATATPVETAQPPQPTQ